MSDIIKDTTPLNLLEQKELFFENQDYNPQFIYSRTFTPEELSIWGQPKEHLFNHAEKMLNQPFETKDEAIISEAFIKKTVDEFNQKYHLDQPISVDFSPHFLSRCRITADTIYFQQPIQYTESKFADLMRHELETHMLRRLNNQLQPWKNTEFPDPYFRKTEEGLAGLHTHLFRDNKIVRKSYLTYSAVYLAQHVPFTEIFAFLRAHRVGPQTAWLIAVRSKRGLRDTSQYGGLTKDLSYLEGMIEVWRWLSDSKNSPYDLYLGRIGLHQLEELKPVAVTEGLRYPSFFDNIEQYRSLIAQIGEINEFSTITL